MAAHSTGVKPMETVVTGAAGKRIGAGLPRLGARRRERERGRPGGGRVGGGEESLRTLPVRDALQSSWELNQSKITDSFGQDRRGEEGSEQKLLPTNVTTGSSHLISSSLSLFLFPSDALTATAASRARIAHLT